MHKQDSAFITRYSNANPGKLLEYFRGDLAYARGNQADLTGEEREKLADAKFALERYKDGTAVLLQRKVSGSHTVTGEYSYLITRLSKKVDMR